MMSKVKYCQRCGTSITCKVEDIQNCFCNTVVLNEQVKHSIAQNFDDCLCETCLKYLASSKIKTGVNAA